MFAESVRLASGTAFFYIMWAKLDAYWSTSWPLYILLAACVFVCVLGGLSTYFRRRGEDEWTWNGLVTTLTLMVSLGFSCGAGFAAFCELWGIPNAISVLICCLVGIFGLDIIEKSPSFGPIMTALKKAYSAFKKEMEDDE